QLYNNNLVGQLPASMGDLTIFNGIYIQYNPQLTGSIPESIGNLAQLQSLGLYRNGLTGEIPSSIGNLKNLNSLELSYNQLTGSVPATITECTNLYGLYLQNNQIENLPDLSAMSNLWNLYVNNNRFQFDDLAPTRTGKPNLYFQYNPQKKFGQVELYNKQTGEALTLTATCGGNGNLYQWYKDGNLLTGKTANTLVFDALALTDRGSYVCKVTNPSVSNLTLESEPMSIIDPTLLDAFEPDNTIATASTIASGIIQQHSIYPVGDVDYASFELTNAPAQVEIRFITALGGRQIQLLTAAGISLITSWDYISTSLTQNGKYYIRTWNPDNQLTDSYQLSLNIKPIVLDKYEPDNNWEQATEILPFFEQDDHNIKIWDDVDYFKFTVSDAPRTVYVDVFDTRRNCNSFGVWLYDTDGTTQLNYSSWGGNYCGAARLEQNITANGTYFIKIAVPQGNGGMRENYTIKVTTDGTAPVIVCNADDRAALVAIYNALNGPNWNNKQGWLTDNVQDWKGVTLNAEGRVTKLNLTRNNLRGTIPTEIGNLIALRYLNLGNDRYVENWNNSNNLNGSTLPVSMANLVNLEVLSLDQLQFYTELPDVFSGMVNLRELYLDQNYFTNAQLPAGLINCSKLERLIFPYNNFSQLPNLTSLTNIQEIQAYRNRLTFEDLEPYASISGFNYSDQAQIGQPLGLNPEPGSTVSQTIEVGGEHNQYQWYMNDLPLEGQTSNTLQIENVSTANAGIYQLRVTNTIATQLTLYSEPIALYQKELPIYKALEAFYNSTGGPNWNDKTNWLSNEPFTSWFGIYQDNEWNSLQLYNNNLVGQLPASMGDLTLFNGIYIGNNQQLTGSIPESIGNLTQLQSLQLYSNGLSGEIPSIIGNLTNLWDLNLQNNRLSGSVPPTLADCSNLRYLYLSNNSLENLPDLSAMNLWYLFAYNNRFQFDDLAPTRIGKPNLYFPY
ncbi:MAG: hypothetical protein Q8J97_16015, partial [Flavobacteriaceae bacterium]|nr:hypothetical protein [Flavobacteriaceae bacterium]